MDVGTGAVLALGQKVTWLEDGAGSKTVLKIGTGALAEILLVYHLQHYGIAPPLHPGRYRRITLVTVTQ